MSIVEVGADVPELFAPESLSTASGASAPKVLEEPPEPLRGQFLLGVDKRNPCISVYEDDAGQRLLVYYGFEFFESVNNDREDPAYKLLLGRLYNAGINLRVLSQTFEVDPKTIRRWGKALLHGDAAELIRVLEGRGAGRKRTPAVEKFARLRWPYLVAEGSYGAVGRLLQEIESVFEVRFSRSGVKDLIRELKTGTPPAPASESSLGSGLADSEPDPTFALEKPLEIPPGPKGQSEETEAKGLIGGSGEPVPQSLENQKIEVVCPPPLSGHSAQRSPFFPRDPAEALYWCDHAGVLIFATALAAVANVSEAPQAILAQWISALWLGAQNIEQTKYLNWEDLQLVLGGIVRFPTPQRDQLKLLAVDTAVIEGLWCFNQQNLGPAAGSDFYFDPHSKHYTGEQNLLKGWCAKLHFADKVLHSDFIHTAQGAPIYFETTDNFADLRQRFCGIIERARKALRWPADRIPTYVVDRAIFGAEFFQTVIGDPSFHLITWQKGFLAQAWDPQQVMGKTTIVRPRNSSTDLRTYHFEYLDRLWEQNPQLRQLVVQATDYKGRTIQVALLTDDLQRPAAEAIHLMFQRWLQENDFKYLDKHFGINQITSYRSVEYAQLKGQVEDREVKSAVRKALALSQKQVTERLKRNLLAEEQACQAQQHRAIKRQQLEAQLALAGSVDPSAFKSLNRQLTALQAADGRYQTTRVERRKSIAQNQQQIVEIQVQIEGTKAKESRLEALIQTQMVKLDGQCKRLMDILKISARNLFYQALQPFKQAYDNYRDDHDHFRQLTQSPGVLEVRSEQILIHLLPRANYGGELRKAVNQTLDQINAKGLEHPCLPGKKLKFRLAQRSEMELKMNVVI